MPEPLQGGQPAHPGCVPTQITVQLETWWPLLLDLCQVCLLCHVWRDTSQPCTDRQLQLVGAWGWQICSASTSKYQVAGMMRHATLTCSCLHV